MEDPIKQEWVDAFWNASAPVLPNSVSDAVRAGLDAAVPLIQADEAKRWAQQAAEASRRVLEMREELEARVLFVRADAKRQIDEARAEVVELRREAGTRMCSRAIEQRLDELQAKVEALPRIPVTMQGSGIRTRAVLLGDVQALIEEVRNG